MRPASFFQDIRTHGEASSRAIDPGLHLMVNKSESSAVHDRRVNIDVTQPERR